MTLKKVYKNDGTIPVDDILCTTYQMRNFYHQFRDGFFTDLDVMNYIQHLSVIRMMKKGDIVLDVCCGRGLLLPMMRYYSKDIKKYIGVDIEEKNMTSKNKNICNGKDIAPEEHYPFLTEWIVSDVADMSEKIRDKINIIVYTSAIEHMHKNHGEKSIRECSKIMTGDGLLFLSCPNTPENQSGYEVRYKAHVYEWKISELNEVLMDNGIEVINKIGLTGSLRTYKKDILPQQSPLVQKYMKTVLEYLPSEFLKPYLFLNHPEESSEVLLICKKRNIRNIRNKKGLLL